MFLAGFCLKPRLNTSFPWFRFDIYFKINLVLPPRFKFINVKNLHLKNEKYKFVHCFVNIFQLINFCKLINFCNTSE